jgi:hypothetical protein
MSANHRRKALDMPPGFATQCPYGLELPIPLVPWVLGAWVAVYALCAETALLGLGLFVLRLRGTIVPWSASMSLLLVTGCTGGALAVAEWITNHNIQSCSALPLPVHVTLAGIVKARRLQAEFLMQGQITLVVLAGTVLVATALTVVTLVRGLRANRRRSEAAPA